MNELIKSHFRKDIHFAGILRLDEVDVAKVTADIKFNPFDTQNIEVRLTDFEPIGNDQDVLNRIERGKKLLLVPVDGIPNMEVQLKRGCDRHWEIPFVNTNVWTTAEEIRETNCHYLSKKSENPCIEAIDWEYRFPITDFTKYRSGITKNNHRGFYRGSNRRDSEGKRTDEIDWEDDVISFSFKNYEVKLYDCFHFGEWQDDDRSYPTQVNARHSVMYIHSPTSGTSVLDLAAVKIIEEDKDEFVKIIFYFLSIFEHKRMKWYYERARTIYDDCSFKEILRHKWISEIRTSMWPNPSYNYHKELRGLLPVLVDHYYQLSPELREQFCNVARCFELACYAPSLEVSLLYWHSCLDILNKIFDPSAKRSMPFSLKLVQACEKKRIEYADLFSKPTGEEIKKDAKNKKFRFTEIRNQYLHDGFVIDDYDELVDLRSKACGLVERMVLKLLNIDYRDTPLGKAEYFT